MLSHGAQRVSGHNVSRWHGASTYNTKSSICSHFHRSWRDQPQGRTMLQCSVRKLSEQHAINTKTAAAEPSTVAGNVHLCHIQQKSLTHVLPTTWLVLGLTQPKLIHISILRPVVPRRNRSRGRRGSRRSASRSRGRRRSRSARPVLLTNWFASSSSVPTTSSLFVECHFLSFSPSYPPQSGSHSFQFSGPLCSEAVALYVR